MFFRSPPSMDAVPSVKDSLQDQHCGVRRTVGGGDSRQRSVGLNTEGTLSISVSHWHLRSLAYPFFLVIFWPPSQEDLHIAVFLTIGSMQHRTSWSRLWCDLQSLWSGQPTSIELWSWDVLGQPTLRAPAPGYMFKGVLPSVQEKMLLPDVYGMVNLSKNWKLLVFLIFPSWSLLPKKTSKNNNNILIHIKQT